MTRNNVLGMRMWLVLFAACGVLSIAFTAAGFRLTGIFLLACLKVPLVGAIAGRLLMRYRETYRFGGIVEGIFQMPFVGIFGVMACYLAAAGGLPLIDDKLVAADRLLGYDWLAYARLCAAHPLLHQALRLAYISGMLQPPVLAAGLYLAGRQDRYEMFVLSMVIGVSFTALIFFFCPATTSWTYLGQEPLAARTLAELPLSHNSWIADLMQVRAGGGRILSSAAGIVAFPSFHCAAAIINTWAAWPVRRLRLPFLVLNAMMIASAPLMGGHYATDLIGGAVVAVVTAMAAGRVHGWLCRLDFRLPAILDPEPVALRARA